VLSLQRVIDYASRVFDFSLLVVINS
jgi:hypothetical protein